MRLLLLFLLCYFLYRYGRYLFAQFRPPQQSHQHTNQTQHTANSNQQTANRKKDDGGEYVDFEEIKD